MAITHFLLESNFSYSPLLQQTFGSHPLRSFRMKRRCALKRNYSPCIKASSKINMNCFIMNRKAEGVKCWGENRRGEDNGIKEVASETGIDGVIWRSMENVMKALKIPVITGVLLGLLFSFDCHHGRLAMAASGGRMGGSSFSSGSSRRSSSSSSRSYSSPSSSTSSYLSGSYHSSSDTCSDGVYWTQISSPASMKGANEVTPIGLDVIVTHIILFVVVVFIIWRIDNHLSERTSVIKLQVGSLGTGRSLQRELNRIAESADTSTSKGFKYVLKETILALLRHSDYCILGYASVDVNKEVEDCEKRFNQLSIEERGKFDEETLVNVNNLRKKSATSQSSNGLCSEYIVVTIIVAAHNVVKLPPIKSSAQLKKALQMLASIPSCDIMGAEVLWTPQKEDDSLTEQEMREDYPMLHPL